MFINGILEREEENGEENIFEEMKSKSFSKLMNYINPLYQELSDSKLDNTEKIISNLMIVKWLNIKTKENIQKQLEK